MIEQTQQGTPPAPPTVNWRRVNFVAFYRKARGWTQQELADRMGGNASRQDVFHWESGRSFPARTRMKSLARALDKSAEEILAGLSAFEPQKAKSK